MGRWNNGGMDAWMGLGTIIYPYYLPAPQGSWLLGPVPVLHLVSVAGKVGMVCMRYVCAMYVRYEMCDVSAMREM
ncbi:hypothetical protein F5Y07DRAFT_137423 [Xylaria sp. FL0933]|nr:hypothetical protein F5Y07DRAFT_137423 [Xylaria sp. FL0933]